eukprot:15435091-Alexandrium_andersonii.AAC.1
MDFMFAQAPIVGWVKQVRVRSDLWFDVHDRLSCVLEPGVVSEVEVLRRVQPIPKPAQLTAKQWRQAVQEVADE